jgi:hypothetical protein
VTYIQTIALCLIIGGLRCARDMLRASEEDRYYKKKPY